MLNQYLPRDVKRIIKSYLEGEEKESHAITTLSVKEAVKIIEKAERDPWIDYYYLFVIAEGPV
jgi:hypothetical protein